MKEELLQNGYKAYEGDEIVVYWCPSICEHAGKCVSGNSQVFDPKRRPWVDLSKAKGIEIAKIVDTCPSKALQYELKINISFDIEQKKSIAYCGKEEIGYCQFDEWNNCFIIRHTEVQEAYNGRGIAKELVLLILEEAKKRYYKIIPLCPYAKKVLSKEEFKDFVRD